MIPPATWTPTFEEYHAHPAWGASMLSELRDNRRLAYALYVERSLPIPPPTASMRFGTLVHALIEGAANSERVNVVVVDCEDRRRKEFKAAQEAALPGQLVYPKGEIADALACAGAILTPKTAAARAARGVLVDHPGESEYSAKELYSDHVELKIRCDRLAEVPGAGIVHADLKTNRDPGPESFPAAARTYGYVYGLALRDLMLEHLGIQPALHLLVVVRSAAPHEIAVYQPNPDAITSLRETLRLDLEELEGLFAAGGEEPWFHPWERQVTPLTAEEAI